MEIDKNDKKLILEFIHDLHSWLKISLLHLKNKEHKWPIIPVREDLVQEATSAWQEFEKDFPPERFTKSITRFGEKRLRAHGLYGAQLRYKLKAVEIAADDGIKGIKGWKRKLIDMLDILLESIGSGLPGYGALKELKDTLLLGID